MESRGTKWKGPGNKYKLLFLARGYKWAGVLIVLLTICFIAFFLINYIENSEPSTGSGNADGRNSNRSDVLVPGLITMLGIMVTSYIFLVVHRNEPKEYEIKNTKKVINTIKDRVILTTIVSVLLIMVFMGVERLETYEDLEYFLGVSLLYPSLIMLIIMLFIMLWIIIFIIAHKALFRTQAMIDNKELLKDMRKIGGHGTRHLSMDRFRRINDLERMIKQVCENHSRELADYFTREEALKVIFEIKNLEETETVCLRHLTQLMNLVTYRNNAIIMGTDYSSNLGENGNDIDNFLEEVETFFYRFFFADETFSGLTINIREKSLEPNFINSEFDNITFLGTNLKEAKMNNAVMKNCRFENVNMEGADCEQADFSDSLFIPDPKKSKENNAPFNGGTGGTKLNYSKFDDVRFADLVCRPDRYIIAEFTTFRRAIFFRSELTKLKFSHGIFTNANFVYAKLIDTDFSFSDMGEVNFTRAKISDSNFSHSDLTNANFDDCIIEKSNSGNDTRNSFYSCTLCSANFKHTTLISVDFSQASCDAADFRESELNDIVFRCTSLKSTNFSGASLRDVDFSFAAWTNAVIVDATISISEKDAKEGKWNKFNETSFTGTRIIGTERSDKIDKRSRCYFEYSTFDNVFFSKVFLMIFDFVSCHFQHLTFLDMRAVDVVFENSPMEYVVFNASRLINVRFKSSLVESQIVLKGLLFKKCEFDSVQFDNIELSNTNFIECEFLTPEGMFDKGTLADVTFTDCKFPNSLEENDNFREFFKGTNIEDKKYSEQNLVKIFKGGKEIVITQVNDSKQRNQEDGIGNFQPNT